MQKRGRGRPSKEFATPPTGFYRWWMAHDSWTDERVSADTLKLDPDHGVCARTVRRIRFGERADSKSIYLLMCVTGLAFQDFIPTAFLKAVGERQ